MSGERLVFLAANGKITDRKDFYHYPSDDKARFACWQQVADAAKGLAEDFMDAVTSGDICHRVQPLATRPQFISAFAVYTYFRPWRKG